MNIKKLLLVAICGITLCGGLKANAMTKDELKEKLTSTYTVNGTKFGATDSQKAEIDMYLAQNDLSSSDCEFIASKLDEAIALIDRGTATSFSSLSGSEKNELISMANEITNKTKVRVTLTDKGVLTIYNVDGTKFTEETTIMKYTDGSDYFLVIAGVVSIIGIATVVKKSLKGKHA